jgi:hypothetical protein
VHGRGRPAAENSAGKTRFVDAGKSSGGRPQPGADIYRFPMFAAFFEARAVKGSPTL